MSPKARSRWRYLGSEPSIRGLIYTVLGKFSGEIIAWSDPSPADPKTIGGFCWSGPQEAFRNLFSPAQ